MTNPTIITKATHPITIPAIAPPESFFLLGGFGPGLGAVAY